MFGRGPAMIQLITFVIIYGIMMYIWSFVYLNRSNDKVNQAFLFFLRRRPDLDGFKHL